MKTYILLAILSIWSVQVFAVTTVRVRKDDIVMSMTGTTNAPNSINVNIEEPSGDGTADTAPVKVYLPILNTLNGGNSKYYVGSVGGSPSVFDVTNAAHVANYPLRINTTATNYYLYAAVKDTSGTPAYKVTKKYSLSNVPIPQNTVNSDLIFPLAPKDICTTLASTARCTNFALTSTTAATESFLIYFFLSTSAAINLGDTVDVATENNGVYFDTSFSNKTYDNAAIDISINKIRPGDKRLIIEYTSANGLSSGTGKSLRVFSHSSITATKQPIGAGYTGTLLPEEYTYAQNGEVTVTNLVNSQAYELSVLFVDKYLFATTLSKETPGTPLEIQELLKKQACFLLTAGFGEEHYVISYFRHFRDTVLTQSYLGRKFISAYYETAPKYALYIYQHDSLRAFIRGIAYSLYFIFNYFALILMTFALLLTSIYLLKNKDKIKI